MRCITSWPAAASQQRARTRARNRSGHLMWSMGTFSSRTSNVMRRTCTRPTVLTASPPSRSSARHRGSRKDSRTRTRWAAHVRLSGLSNNLLLGGCCSAVLHDRSFCKTSSPWHAGDLADRHACMRTCVQCRQDWAPRGQCRGCAEAGRAAWRRGPKGARIPPASSRPARPGRRTTPPDIDRRSVLLRSPQDCGHDT